MDNLFSVSTNTYHRFSLDDALDGIAAAGFKNVELTAVKGWTEHVSAGMSDIELADIKKKCEVHGLTPISLSGHCDLVDEARLLDFMANIELASRLGCKYIVTSIGEAHFGRNKESSEALLISHISRAVERCKKFGITMVLETHGEFGTGKSLADITRQINSPYLGINYDTANVVFYGKTLPDEDIQTCIDQVKYVHLKEKAGAVDEWNFPALGKGFLKLDSVLEHLIKTKNRSPISVEIEFTQAGPKDLAEVNKAVKDSFEFLNQLGVI